MEPIRNFDRPYAIDNAVRAVPRAAFECSGCAFRMSGMARARLLRTR